MHIVCRSLVKLSRHGQASHHGVHTTQRRKGCICRPSCCVAERNQNCVVCAQRTGQSLLLICPVEWSLVGALTITQSRPVPRSGEPAQLELWYFVGFLSNFGLAIGGFQIVKVVLQNPILEDLGLVSILVWLSGRAKCPPWESSWTASCKRYWILESPQKYFCCWQP